MIFKRVSIKIIAMIIALQLAASPARGIDDGTARLIKFAAGLYREKKYDEALAVYKELLKKDPDSALLNYNAGLIYYKQEEYQAAIGSFTIALNTEDHGIERDTLAAIGDSYYRLSEAAETADMKASMELCVKAGEYYKAAMDVDEKDQRPKFNKEVADRRIITLKERARKGRQAPPPVPGANKKNKYRKDQEKKERKRRQEDKKTSDKRKQEDRERSDRRDQEDKQEDSQRKAEDKDIDQKRRTEDQKKEDARKEEDAKDRADKGKPQDDKSREDRQKQRDEQRKAEDQKRDDAREREDEQREDKRQEEDRKKEEKREQEDRKAQGAEGKAQGADQTTDDRRQKTEDQRKQEDRKTEDKRESEDRERSDRRKQEDQKGQGAGGTEQDSERSGEPEPSAEEEPREEKTEESSGEMSETSANMIIDVYWDGEAPKRIIQQEKGKKKQDVLKDW